MSVNGRMNKQNVVCAHTHTHYSAMEKKEILPFATRMDFQGITLRETSQRKQILYDPTFYGIKKK